jgi:glycogen debranching enzyme
MSSTDQVSQASQYYIVSAAPSLGERSLVLKGGDLFGVFDISGNIDSDLQYDAGLYFKGTRFLSKLGLWLSLFESVAKPHLLSSSVRADNVLLAADLTNPDIYTSGRVVIPRGSLQLSQRMFLREGVLYQQVLIRSYTRTTIQAGLVLEFDADYVDIFEVRGQHREKRGTARPPLAEKDRLTFAYQGLDGVERSTAIRFERPIELFPINWALNRLSFTFDLAPGGEQTLIFSVLCSLDGAAPRLSPFAEALQRTEQKADKHVWNGCEICSSDEQFNSWIRHSQADIEMMLTETASGLYPYAGVPWFSTPFGRDGIITALQCLWLAPDIAKGVLAYLAATQAIAEIPKRDAEPGKILHEAREGEMATLEEIPFGRYYGSIDSTPLFLVLAGCYFIRTGDLEFIRGLWPNIEAAFSWINNYGDIDGDGFVEYQRRSETGLLQQGWKDSYDSVFHANGELAEPPIALCEVQSYVYAAKKFGAEMARVLGLAKRAEELDKQADLLKVRFNSAFWVSELGTYALALDGHKNPCQISASNAGHCLFGRIADSKLADMVTQKLMSERSFSRWGVRTVAEGESRYNPMSYHNGSVWPHDNSLISTGFARYGFNHESVRLLDSLFAASAFFEGQRLPELFCGFERSTGNGPTLYPVACSPQAWASGAALMLLQSSLGIWINAPARRILLSRPRLPSQVTRLEIRGLKVNDASIHILIRRDTESVSASVPKQKGRLDLILTNDPPSEHLAMGV